VLKGVKSMERMGHRVAFFRYREQMEEWRKDLVKRDIFRPAWYVLTFEVEEIPPRCIKMPGLLCRDNSELSPPVYTTETLYFDPVTEAVYVDAETL